MFADEPTPSTTPSPETGTTTAAASPFIPDSAAAAIEDDLFCPKCGYNLRSLTSNRCPECGYDIQAIRQRQTQIPWVYRDKEGTFRAYWKTVWMVIFKNEQFCFEISRPVDEGHARSFRRMTMLHAYLPILILTLLWSISGLTVVTPEEWIFAAVINISIIACIVLTTAVPHYAPYRPDVSAETLHRAAVLTFYTCAPLAWMFIIVLFVIAGYIGGRATYGMLDAIMYLSAGCGFITLLGVMFVETQRLIRRMLGGNTKVRGTTAKIAILWFLAVFTTIVGIPLAAGFLALVYYSLQ